VQRANIHPGDFYWMYIAQAANKLCPRDSLKCSMLQRNAVRRFAFHLAAIMHSVEHCTWLLLVVSLQFISNNNYAETRPSKIGRAENWRDLPRFNERRVKVARLKLYAEESARAGKIAQDAKVERQQSSR